MPSDQRWQTTTWCQRHGRLEAVSHEDVLSVGTFLIQERDPVTGFAGPTTRSACEVRAITDAGCKVRFIGGARWIR